MNVVVMNLDNTSTMYAFAPEHKAEAIGFYTKAYWAGRIQGFKAILADGSIVAIGAN